jgi:hypothetical protein
MCICAHSHQQMLINKFVIHKTSRSVVAYQSPHKLTNLAAHAVPFQKGRKTHRTYSSLSTLLFIFFSWAVRLFTTRHIVTHHSAHFHTHDTRTRSSGRFFSWMSTPRMRDVSGPSASGESTKSTCLPSPTHPPTIQLSTGPHTHQRYNTLPRVLGRQVGFKFVLERGLFHPVGGHHE